MYGWILWVRFYSIHCVPKNVATLACYNFDIHRTFDNFWQKSCFKSKQSNGTFFLHLT